MFVQGGLPLDVPVESLAVTSPVAPREALDRGKVPPLFIMEQGGIRHGNVPLPLRKREFKDNFSRIRKNKHYITSYIHHTQKKIHKTFS